jgi:hypothetical protein
MLLLLVAPVHLAAFAVTLQGIDGLVDLAVHLVFQGHCLLG